MAREGSHRAVVGAGRRVCRRHPNPASQPSQRFLHGEAINHVPGTGCVRSNPRGTVMDGGRSLWGDSRGVTPCPTAAPSPARAQGSSAGSNSWIGRVCRGTGRLPTLLVTLLFFPKQWDSAGGRGCSWASPWAQLGPAPLRQSIPDPHGVPRPCPIPSSVVGENGEHILLEWRSRAGG